MYNPNPKNEHCTLSDVPATYAVPAYYAVSHTHTHTHTEPKTHPMHQQNILWDHFIIWRTTAMEYGQFSIAFSFY